MSNWYNEYYQRLYSYQHSAFITLISTYFETMISSENLSSYHMSKLDLYNEDIQYHNDYINVNKHTEINNTHKVSETVVEMKLEIFSNSDEQFTAQFRLVNSLTKLCVCKECHWEFSSENQLHHHLLICQKCYDEISETWMIKLKSSVFLIVSWALKATCERYVFQE